MQVPSDVLTWLQSMALDKQTVKRVANFAFEEVPTVANAEANIKAISSMLHISEAQVWASRLASIGSCACFVHFQVSEAQRGAGIGLHSCIVCAAYNGARRGLVLSRLCLMAACVHG